MINLFMRGDVIRRFTGYPRRASVALFLTDACDCDHDALSLKHYHVLEDGAIHMLYDSLHEFESYSIISRSSGWNALMDE